MVGYLYPARKATGFKKMLEVSQAPGLPVIKTYMLNSTKEARAVLKHLGAILFLFGVYSVDLVSTPTMSHMTAYDWIIAVPVVLVPMIAGIFFILVGVNTVR